MIHQPASMSLGPHPILDTLISWEPEGSHVRELFAPADDYQRAEFAVRQAPAALVLEPDAVHDPEPTQTAPDPQMLRQLMRALVSQTPTGSINLRLRAGAR